MAPALERSIEGLRVEKRNEKGQSAPAVEAARVAIWRLFEEGYVDEDMATAGLLAVDVGTRRTRRRIESHRMDAPRSRVKRPAA
jgi:hypothetical protein